MVGDFVLILYIDENMIRDLHTCLSLLQTSDEKFRLKDLDLLRLDLGLGNIL